VLFGWLTPDPHREYPQALVELRRLPHRSGMLAGVASWSTKKIDQTSPEVRVRAGPTRCDRAFGCIVALYVIEVVIRDLAE